MLIRRNKSIFAVLMFALLCVAVVVNGSFAASTSSLRPEGVPADYPNKEIEFIYGFGPGSLNDAYIRILTSKIKEMEGWDHGFIISYKTGAGGRIGWSALSNAKPDGYHIGFVPTAALIPAIAEDVAFDYDTYSYIFNMMSDPGAIGVAIDSPYNTLKDIVAAAKESSVGISFGVTSITGQEGLTLKLIQKATGVKFKIIAFTEAAEAISLIIGKHMDAFCLNVGDTTTALGEKKIKVIATGGKERSVFLPDVPTYRESGFDVVQVNMRSFAGPAGMPEPIRQYLENCFMAAAKDPEVIERATKLQVPVHSLRGTEVKTRFGEDYTALKTLWESDPW